MILIPNKQVACTPFEDIGVKQTQLSRGVVGMSQKVALTPLKVVYGDTDHQYQPGDTVYVYGECARDQWATRVLELEGNKMILVPFDRVCAVAYTAPRYVDRPAPTSIPGNGQQ